MSTKDEAITVSPNGQQTDVIRSFSEDKIYTIWQHCDDKRNLILLKRDDSDNPTEKMCLTFTANCIGEVMDEIAELLEPSGSFFCDEKYKTGYTCEDGQCDRCAKLCQSNCV